MTPKGNNTLNFRLAPDQVVHLETAANLFVSQPLKSPAKFLAREGIHCQEKGFITTKTYQINKAK